MVSFVHPLSRDFAPAIQRKSDATGAGMEMVNEDESRQLYPPTLRGEEHYHKRRVLPTTGITTANADGTISELRSHTSLPPST
jgi:hypothetical protein